MIAEALMEMPLDAMMAQARQMCDAGHGRVQTWSRKVFIPLTHLCRDRCHYCTFAQPPRQGEAAYLSREEVLAIARAGAAAGCTEALFTLGDKPELRYGAARDALARMGYATTIAYLIDLCRAVRDETGLLPHVNAGVMSREEMAALRDVSVSQGLMLESLSPRLCGKGGPHYRSPDKEPGARLAMLRHAGELAIPFTTGLLIGIGENRAERIEALEAIAAQHRQHGHVQEVIVQNFRAKPRTPMADAPEPDLDDLLWTIAAARLILGPAMNIQAPPNLSAQDFPRLMEAGINDWGGVSPVTIDHVNPEAPWPEVERLRLGTEQAGRQLVARLPAYPAWLGAAWQAPAMRPAILAASDAQGFARDDSWSPGVALPERAARVSTLPVDPAIAAAMQAAMAGQALDEAAIVTLFSARDADLEHVCAAADQLRQEVKGEAITYVVNRNINYTNICSFKCGFCAFSKGDMAEALRGRPYDLSMDEVIRRTREAAERGATEVCLQGGIHPHYTGETYLGLARAVRAAVPEMHIHAFSPLEVSQGAKASNLSLEQYLTALKEVGLDTLPGTAAEILDDEVRAQICPDKLTTEEWLEVIETAHRVGFTTTATIMFGHVETPLHWARHLIRIRDLQERTGGFTEFVPLPFVHMEAPMAIKGKARRGPTFREVRLMHAVARLVLHGRIDSIQTSWVKLGEEGVKACLNGGANDLGGTLMNESISRAAGAAHGQEMPPAAMEALILALGRVPRQRSTAYGGVSESMHQRGLQAAALTPMIQTPPRRKGERANDTANDTVERFEHAG
ncbi:5-amino-6-(D-ribitylamino)uracil--L-tyrosine 4-hydroxyphenyl transferase CofH [Novosphingobium rosa]|uniref:5-amino-6-(D-ribitylamino)uracil--L-tyrosine 4-hydroxyphenyl transferase CofH n=1 Tax=Novosphingobium rosa TaxID=76978 RepID=UPI000833769D|nr:5-amino-6-(D-ribitylamino)uracil--L-tyrosine 4-hydroxyphenyl transferase CofH [Novosphingobium rosa]